MREPSWSIPGVALHVGDCLDVLKEMPDASVDAVVTDPPAGISFMGKSWDADKGGRRLWVGWLTDVMCEVRRVLKPGGHALVWALPRTSHWTATALEDAGLEIRDCIVHIFGSGFPKSLDVGKAIDVAGGASPKTQADTLRKARERAGLSREQVATAVGCTVSSVRDWEEGRARAAGRAVEYIVPSSEYRARLADLLGYSADERAIVGVTTDRRGDATVIGLGHSGRRYAGSNTHLARTWAGWGTALKPGQEHWWLCRRPLDGTVAANVLEHGTGALNIGACRVGDDLRINHAGGASSLQRVSRVAHGYRPTVTTSVGQESQVSGRWPTNLVFSHSQGCIEDGPCEQGCSVAELDRQSGVRRTGGDVSGQESSPRFSDTYGESARAPFAKHGDAGGASRYFPVFRYEAKAPASERPKLPDGTAWPTVKPLALMRWLVRLVTPPNGVVLDPFAGTGTTGEAALIEGFRSVLVERDPAAVELIKTRFAKPIAPTLDLFGEETTDA